MAKSAKDKLAVDGTPNLAAKSKPSDKHEKMNLSVEEATIESPRASRKRAGDFFDFGDEADRVADELAGVDAKSSGKASASKASKPSKKSKSKTTNVQAKRDEKEGKIDKEESLEDRVVSQDTRKTKGKKADTTTSDIVIGSSGDTTAIPKQVPETANKAEKGKGKKADTAVEDALDTKKTKDAKTNATKEATTDAKKGKGKKADAARKAVDDSETIEDRVVAENAKQKTEAKKQKSKKADDSKKDLIVGPSGDTATQPDAVPETANKAKKSKAAKDSAAAKSKADEAKVSKKVTEKPLGKEKPETSKESKKFTKDSDKTKKTVKTAEPKEKRSKSKTVNESASADPAPSTKKGKTPASKAAAPGKSMPTSPGDAMDQTTFENLLDSTDKGKTPAPDTAKVPKAPKTKKDAKKPNKEPVANKGAKEAKDSDITKPKRAAKAKDNKPDIPDQAIQPMNLVEEEAALNELSKPEPSKGKKRNAPSDVATDTLKSNLLDPLSAHAGEESATKKQKKSRKSLGETLGDIVATGADAVRNSFTGILGGGVTDGKPTTAGSSQKQSKGKSKATDANEPQPTANEDDESGDEEEAPDGQIAALLAGFDSDGDDIHPPVDAGFEEGNNIPSLPNSAATSKKLKALKSTGNELPGVVYVGRIPHGFYEHEMRSYFSQFGDLNRLRLSRSVKTGQSKHYAFLEFKSEDVAKVVAETMDNYLMFGHILKCKVVAPGDVHEKMWKGADKRFKKVPWNKIEGRKLEMAVGRDVWKKREEKETVKRVEKSTKMLETIGYAFEGTGLKSVDSVPTKIITATTEQEKGLVTAGGEDQAEPVVVSEEVTSVNINKRGKAVAEAANANVKKVGKRALDGGEGAVASITKKAKKKKEHVTA